MSKDEIIAGVAVFVVVVGVLAYSYQMHEAHERTEPASTAARESDFDRSFGTDFRMGPFTRVVNEQVSGGKETDCTREESVVAAALHDLDTRFGTLLNATSSWSAFEVNDSALGVFCNRFATTTLTDAAGDTLTITKPPFTRGLPQGDTAGNTGTVVRLDASLVPQGASAPTATSSAELLIPDKYLDPRIP